MNFNCTKAKTARLTSISGHRPLDVGLEGTEGPLCWEEGFPRYPHCGWGVGGQQSRPCPWHWRCQPCRPPGAPQRGPPGVASQANGPFQLYADQNSSQQVWNWEYAGSFLFFSGHVRNPGTEEQTYLAMIPDAGQPWTSKTCKRISYDASLHHNRVCDASVHDYRLKLDSGEICKAAFTIERPLMSEAKGLILTITNKSYSNCNKGTHSFLYKKPCIFKKFLLLYFSGYI